MLVEPIFIRDEWALHPERGCKDEDPADPSARFFATPHSPEAAEAKALCQTCPVLDECGLHAMTYPEPFGVWGGTDEVERRALRALSLLP